jgi:hypothetical protein
MTELIFIFQMIPWTIPDELDENTVELHEVIGQGYFGIVYRATICVRFNSAIFHLTPNQLHLNFLCSFFLSIHIVGFRISCWFRGCLE